jgi:protein-disulfide isomerase
MVINRSTSNSCYRGTLRAEATLTEHLVGAANAQTATSLSSTAKEMVLGNPAAEVQIVEYASFTCPHCAKFHANQLEGLKTSYITPGMVGFTYREVFFDRPGLWASMIARCTGDTEFFFAFTTLLFEKQREWLANGEPAEIVGQLRKLAKVAGLDDATLDACLSDGAKAEGLYAWSQANVSADQITATPSFVIDTSNRYK